MCLPPQYSRPSADLQVLGCHPRSQTQEQCTCPWVLSVIRDSLSPRQPASSVDQPTTARSSLCARVEPSLFFLRTRFKEFWLLGRSVVGGVVRTSDDLGRDWLVPNAPGTQGPRAKAEGSVAGGREPGRPECLGTRSWLWDRRAAGR